MCSTFYLLYCIPSFFQRDLYKGLPEVITLSSSHTQSPSKRFIANLANLSAQPVKAFCCFYLFLMLSDKNVNTTHSGNLNQLHICTADCTEHIGTFKWMGNRLKDITEYTWKNAHFPRCSIWCLQMDRS